MHFVLFTSFSLESGIWKYQFYFQSLPLCFKTESRVSPKKKGLLAMPQNCKEDHNETL